MNTKLTLLALTFVCGSAHADFSLNKLTAGDKLPSLTSSITKSLGFTKVSVPYANEVQYFGLIDKDSKPDEVIKGKNAFYMYVWVPAAMDELGVRMISPVGELAKPSKDDFVQANFKAKFDKKDTTWFDTWLRVERMDVISPESIKDAKTVFSVLDNDDDGDDTYEEKRHAKYNSLVRIKTEVSNPKKALVRGLYRIAFTTYKTGDVAGSFVATIGTNVPGVVVSDSLENLHKLVNK